MGPFICSMKQIHDLANNFLSWIYYNKYSYSDNLKWQSWNIHDQVPIPTANNSSLLPIKVIAAEGEQKASKALKEAADIIAQSPAALQLRYLQVRSESL